MSNVVRLEYAYGICPKCKCGNYLRYLICKDGLTHKPYEIKCINCNSYFKKEDIFGNGEETTPKPQTNADRIRQMSDEELTRFFAENCGCDEWCMHKRSGACASKSENECCLDVWYRWLKSPVEKL